MVQNFINILQLNMIIRLYFPYYFNHFDFIRKE